MKRCIHRLFTFLPALLLTLAGTGCAYDIEPDTPAAAAPDSITLELTVPMEPSTRAAKTETDLNEFKVTSVHLYFYKSGEGDDVPSTYDYIVDGYFEDTKTVYVPMPGNALEEGGLFGGNNTCQVYAVANVDADGTLLPEGEPKSVKDLKAQSVSSTFNETKVQDSFAMDGLGTVNIDDRTTRRASGKIEFTRAAAKMTLAIKLPESVNQTINGTTTTYTPNTGGMHVWIGNGVKDSKLNTEPVNAATTALYSNERNAIDGTGSKFIKDDAMADGYIYVQDIPFYSYPNKWDASSPIGNTHLTLVVPWTYTITDAEGKEQTSQISTYYRFAVQPDQCEISRNTHYDMRVSINRLGSLDPQEPINMVFDWNYAIPWKKQGLETDIKAIRFLILNQNYYKDGAYVFEMNNETETAITLGTSHDVEIAEVTLSCIDYSTEPTATPRKVTLTTDGSYKYSSIKGYEANSIYAGIEVFNPTTDDNNQTTDENNKVTIHTLKFKRDFKHIAWTTGTNEDIPSITGNNAFCAYTFDIKLWHKDDHSRTATVRIIQYPAIYITADLTPSDITNSLGYITTRFVNNNNTSKDNYKGFVGASGNNNGLHLGSIHEGKNRNTYVITISRFDENEKDTYIIADPRSRNVDNLLYQENRKSYDWSLKDEKGKSLQYYYPTDNSSTKTRYIAPKFRIASQMGITYAVYNDAALRRCASYQENGRPAGRWRLPTIAEIEFIAKLSNEKHIPFLFGDKDEDADYWCASGAVKVVNTGETPKVQIINKAGTGQRYARCVYDEWYWNDVLNDPTKFTWGDRQRGDNNIDTNIFQLKE